MWASSTILTILLGARYTTAAAVPQNTASVNVTMTSGEDDEHHNPPWILPGHKDWHNPTCYWYLHRGTTPPPPRVSFFCLES